MIGFPASAFVSKLIVHVFPDRGYEQMKLEPGAKALSFSSGKRNEILGSVDKVSGEWRLAGTIAFSSSIKKQESTWL